MRGGAYGREMGTRRSGSARLPDSGLGSVSSRSSLSSLSSKGQKFAYDPLESEADRLLASTCARLCGLGTLSVKNGEDLLVRRRVRHEDAGRSGAADEIQGLRNDLVEAMNQINEDEEAEEESVGRSYKQYRSLMGIRLVAHSLVHIVSHLEFALNPKVDLEELIDHLRSVAERYDEVVEKLSTDMKLAGISREGQIRRHEESMKRAGYRTEGESEFGPAEGSVPGSVGTGPDGSNEGEYSEGGDDDVSEMVREASRRLKGGDGKRGDGKGHSGTHPIPAGRYSRGWDVVAGGGGSSRDGERVEA